MWARVGEWTRADGMPPQRAGTRMGTDEEGERARSVVIQCLNVGGGLCWQCHLCADTLCAYLVTVGVRGSVHMTQIQLSLSV